MLTVYKKFITNNIRYNSASTITIKGVVIHSIGCHCTDADIIQKNFNSPNEETRVHAVVDDRKAIQMMLWNKRGAHTGGATNGTHIGIEMCEPCQYNGEFQIVNYNAAANMNFFNSVWKNAVTLTAYLCKRFGLNPSTDVLSHHETGTGGHIDPDHWWVYHNKNMSDFRADVASMLSSGKIDISVDESGSVYGTAESVSGEGGAPTTSGLGSGAVTGASTATTSAEFQSSIDMEAYNSFYNDYMANYKDEYYNTYVNSVSTAINKDDAANLFLQKARGVHGMPYQYNSYVDSKLTDSIFGRKYAEKIVTKMPLLLISPGKPKFMGTYKDDEKKNILSYIGDKAEGGIAELLESKKEAGLLYDFEYDYADYYNYVNPMCQIMSKYLGLENKKIDGTTLDNFRWENFTNSQFKNYFSSNESIAFYVDSETQISESFGNETTKSILDDGINSLNALGREMQFLLGGDNGPQFEFLKSQNYDSTSEAFTNWMNQNVGILPTTLVSRLTEGGLNIVTGGKMIFPEIWSDSSFSKSYSIKIKLRSPDCDDFSIYMNILAPLAHLIALVAPHSKGNTSFNSPFIVKAYYKSIFNCNMGIITDMSISKGETSKWTATGLPTEVDVDFTIKDLYQILTITSQTTKITDKNSIDVLSNTLLMDYIANMCGVNINKPDILRTIDMYLTQIMNREWLTGRIDNGLLKLEQSLANNLKGVSKIFSIFHK